MGRKARGGRFSIGGRLEEVRRCRLQPAVVHDDFFDVDAGGPLVFGNAIGINDDQTADGAEPEGSIEGTHAGGLEAAVAFGLDESIAFAEDGASDEGTFLIECIVEICDGSAGDADGRAHPKVGLIIFD